MNKKYTEEQRAVGRWLTCDLNETHALEFGSDDVWSEDHTMTGART